MADVRAHEFVFGAFRMLPDRRLLLSQDTPVRLGSRAFDLLQLLVERHGELIGKEELVSRVWPNTYVDETNLRVHVAAVRRALGEGGNDVRYLANEPGRGYRFIAPVNVVDGVEGATSEVPSGTPHTSSLPLPLVRVVGRDEIVRSLAEQLPRWRLLSIVGPAGIGKTTVAAVLAEAVAPSYADGVCYADLSVLNTDAMVPSALATALGLPVHTQDPAAAIVLQLAAQRRLLLLDGCEAVLEGATELSEFILKAAPGVHIVTTSREPLRAEGERVVRLPPLGVPASANATAANTLAHPAVELFVERASATLDGFVLTDEDAPLVAEICRRLDGIPLAIELAAGRIDAFGIRGVADMLNDRFRLLTGGRRRALPRHQTLAAALDWSYDLLTEEQATLFRRLGVFSGGFGLDAIVEVAGTGEAWQAETPMLVASLVAKSLLSADVSGPISVYRLLDTTRDYSLRKLAEAGEVEAISRRHALFNLASLNQLEHQWLDRVVDADEARFRLRLDNTRAALDWCFGPGGQMELGAALTAASVLMWMHLSLVDECRTRVERAIEMSPRGEDEASWRRDMRLHAALGLSVMFTRGSVAAAAALTRTLELAESLGDEEYMLRALWGLWVGKLNSGTIPDSLEIARRFGAMAASSHDPVDRIVADRMMGFSLHFLGQHADARRAMERMLGADPGHRIHSHSYRFQFDLWTTARATLAESLWIQGFADQALDAAREAAKQAAAIEHAMTTCNTLAKTSAVALHAGDLALAEEMITSLRATADAHALIFWRAEGGCLEGVRRIHAGDLKGGLDLLRGQLRDFPGNSLTVRYIAYLGELAEALSKSGLHEEAHDTIAAALLRCQRNTEHWCMPEILRIEGDLLQRSGGPSDEVEQIYRKSLDWSQRHAALSWELRTCMSMARLLRGTSREAEGLSLLANARTRFTEGFQTADLRHSEWMLAAI